MTNTDTHQAEIEILATDDAAAAAAATLVEGPPQRRVIVSGRARYSYLYLRAGGGGHVADEIVSSEDIDAYEAEAEEVDLFGPYL